MTSNFLHRSITTETLDWHGYLIQVTFERQSYVDHLQIETLEPQRAALPITETGYRSHFVSKGLIEREGGPADYVAAWLEHAATDKAWRSTEMKARQFSLF